MAGSQKEPCFLYWVFIILLIRPGVTDRSLHTLFQGFFWEFPTQLSFLQGANRALDYLQPHLN
jgi:hypothetical protein